MNRHVKRIVLLAAVALLWGGFGCGDDHDDHDNNEHSNNEHSNNEHEEEALVDHACGHATDGPFVPDDGSALQAGTSADEAGLPVLHFGEWATVELSDEDDDGSYEGFVIFEPADSGEHVLFSSVAWPGEDAESTDSPYIIVTHEDGGDDPIFELKEPIGEEPGCVEINFGHHYAEFVAGDHYIVEITGHPESEISIVPVPAGEEEGHDH
ncbi:MAG: hypothetical protein ACLFVJ_18580 [Persicimonas sp.]